MRTSVIAATQAFLRLSFLDSRRKHRNLSYQLAAAAMRTLLNVGVAARFKQLGYLATLAAFIFKNRHIKSPISKKSGRVDLNHRPLGPEPSALIQAELRPENTT
jgi:hypothetical protein